MRSEYSREQLLEQNSIHYLLGKCINLNWKYRQYDQDNDVDGEIEIFEEEKEILKYIAKSKYIKLSSKVMGYAIELDNFKYYKENNYNNYYISKRLEDLKKICIEVTNLPVEQLESMKI